jgi:hypothetical protein
VGRELIKTSARLSTRNRLLTSTGTDAASERNDWGNTFIKELCHFLDKFPADTAVSTHETVGTNKESSTCPRGWHCSAGEWIRERCGGRKRITIERR